VRRCAQTLSIQIETLDDNTDGQIELSAPCRNFDRSQTVASENFGLVDAECWLIGYWNVLVETRNTLNDQRGAQERVSLKLLVEELCQLWEQETRKPVTAHGLVKDVYTSRVETDAGRFVTAAVEAMLPEPDQIDDRPTNEPAKIPHDTTASPDSLSTASQIGFATGTPLPRAAEGNERSSRTLEGTRRRGD
jgi:hypothetical protein